MGAGTVFAPFWFRLHVLAGTNPFALNSPGAGLVLRIDQTDLRFGV
jgi:hypothetical protein